MKKISICCALCLFASSAYAALKPNDAKRLDQAAAVVGELRDAPDGGIPQDLWHKAECVVVIPSVKKAAFAIGGEAGTGVMSCRSANAWSAPVFMHLAKGSFGLQFGAEETDLILLVMNRTGVDKLLQDKVSLGTDASLAAGPVGRSANAATDAQMNAEMLSYSRSRGIFAGIDLSGGVLRPDTDANARAYGAGLSAHDIVEGSGRVAAPAAARSFQRALARDAGARTQK